MSTWKKSVLALWMLGFVVGCAKDPSEGVAKAKVEPAAAPAKAVPAIVSIQLGGSVLFTGSKVTGSHACQLTETKGTVGLAGDDLANATLQFQANTTGLHCDPESRTEWSPKLEKHLRDKDFFWSSQYPTASFDSSSIEASAKKGEHTHDVKGQLTLRGVTKTITFPATITLSKEKVSGKAKFAINRKDFGIEYPGKVDDLIRDNVVLEVTLEGAR
jgi:polyisoprenoid-binding protein YceI